MRTTIGSSAYDKISEKVKAKAFNSDWEHGIKRAYDGGSQDWPIDVPGYKPKKPLFGRRSNSTIILSSSALSS
jgi:hypothetical protein